MNQASGAEHLIHQTAPPTASWPAAADAAGRSLDGRSTPIAPRRLSQLLLRLYDAARYCAVPAFQDQAMRLLADDLRFDGSWCGRSTRALNGVQVHCSHLQNLPDDSPVLLNLSDTDNTVAGRSIAAPEQAMIFTPKELFAQPSTAMLADYMQVANVLCITSIDSRSGVANFVSLSRRDSQAEFCEHDRQLLELLSPHLFAALDLCCSMQLTRLRQAVNCDKTVMASTDAKGFVNAAEAGFAAMMQREWPAWHGSRLPAELVQPMDRHQPQFLGRHLHAGFDWFGEYVLLTLRPRQPHDTLTTQERAVANAFAAGQSYKEVARLLQLAPATVRHHLRAVYSKLGVSDKAALVAELGVHQGPRL